MILLSNDFIMWYWIGVGIVALLAVLIHTGIENMGMFELDDILDTFFGEFGWVTMLVVAGLGGIIFLFIFWSWKVMLSIVLGILGLFVIIGIIFLVICCFDKDDENQEDENEKLEYEYFDPEYENVEDYVNNPKALSAFSLKQLKEYCEDNEIEGYKGLTKVELIELIIKYNNPGEYADIVEENPKEKVEKLVVKSNKKGIRFDDIAGLKEAKEAF